jgi:antitoxin ParD1/3/4
MPVISSEMKKRIPMAAKPIQRNIRFTPHFDTLLRRKVASGRYESASDVVREGLRLLEQRDRDLQRMNHDIELGWQQSERGDLLDGPGVFAEIRSLSKSRRAKGAAAK